MEKTKRILFILILLTLLLPLLQEKLKLFTVKPLKGAITAAEKKSFDWRGWFEGEYQAEQEKYLNENFGLRNLYLRINNQIDFDLFRKVHARDVVIGKQNYLYEKGYIHAYNGQDFMGIDSLNELTSNIKFIQDELKKININLIVVFAPSKASYFPEFIPDKLLRKNQPTNYHYLSKALKESGINFIDFNHWFLEMKANAPYPLYPKCGTHWSVYGYTLVADSLSRYVEAMCKMDLPELKIDSVVLSDTYRDTDYDIGEGLNLLFEIKGYKMAYPVIDFTEEGKEKPRVLTIGDSYYWNLFGSGLAARIFEEPHFWYYYYQLYRAGYNGFLGNGEVNLEKEIKQQRVIMLLSTEVGLPTLGWGFIPAMVDYFSHNRENKINTIAESIKATPDWLKLVAEKANRRNIPLDSMIMMDALYLYEEQLKK